VEYEYEDKTNSNYFYLRIILDQVGYESLEKFFAHRGAYHCSVFADASVEVGSVAGGKSIARGVGTPA
jgi:hypothetical protein